MKRKEWKSNARSVLKRHYWLFVVLCLIAAVLGTECTSSMNGLKMQYRTDWNEPYESQERLTDISQLSSQIVADSIGDVLLGDADAAEDAAEGEDGAPTQAASSGEETEESAEAGNAVFGRTRGVFATLVNGFLSGSFLSSLIAGIRSITGSHEAATVIYILAALAVMFFLHYFFLNVCQSVIRRMFLEGRCYDQVSPGRALFLLKVKRWRKAALTLMLQSVLGWLWSLTIVGGIIKRYSYAMVPYIVAENPDLGARQAVTLSRKLMKGHKWELFLVDLSFLGWEILGGITLGLLNLFYVNPYRIATKTEFYAYVRKAGKEAGVPDADLLNDRYLYEQPGQDALDKAYVDVVRMEARTDTALGSLRGIRRWIADIFGLVLWNDREEKRYEQEEAEAIRLAARKEEWKGHSYPTRLYPIPESQKREWVETAHYIRHYTLWSMILLFFVMSMVGWIWEVTLHLITNGTLVNRGVLHGPWLPIYGTGSVLILLLLNKFRKKPWLEFILAVALCGCVEYYISWHLEQVYDGMKWWDYTGYFLNINGRVCAEGLLTFGLGGMLIVYLLAPMLDNLFRKIPKKILVAVCAALLVVYCADQFYSGKHPNTGEGVTDIGKEADAGGESLEIRAAAELEPAPAASEIPAGSAKFPQGQAKAGKTC